MVTRNNSLTLAVVLLIVLIVLVYIKLPSESSRRDSSIEALASEVSEIIQLKAPVARPSQPGDSPEVKDWRDVVSRLKGEWALKPDMQCMNVQKAGNWRICVDGHFQVKPPCLVYSFGINTDWSFDEYMGNLSCEVHSFDPSIGMDDHIHSPNVHFHNLGLGPLDTDTFQPELDTYVRKKTFWKVRTLESIMKMLGHEGKTIDVLKMDVETDEWEVMINFEKTGLLPNIKQFMLEWHLFHNRPSRKRFVDFYNAYTIMKDSGYKSYHVKFHNRDSRERTLALQADITYMNTKFKTKYQMKK